MFINISGICQEIKVSLLFKDVGKRFVGRFFEYQTRIDTHLWHRVVFKNIMSDGSVLYYIVVQ